MVDDKIWAFSYEIEVAVSDKAGYLQQRVCSWAAVSPQPSHLAVHPHQCLFQVSCSHRYPPGSGRRRQGATSQAQGTG
eukprot:CAMPEP_0115121888 /NCGR_PEP_ID=MMETSP0227-20121206/46500_1 /TAXON_ID=89957 /ORGANISM="Polarella glacialis, Strain CCMP 1383" /LENGTH=77 /DNA_ID=CAMNT_0002523725 /DNA_START=439 /DNA_END=668 /DNA_ORIENTATION=+